MASPVGGGTRLDVALDAVATLAVAAEDAGDRVGALAFAGAVTGPGAPRGEAPKRWSGRCSIWSRPRWRATTTGPSGSGRAQPRPHRPVHRPGGRDARGAPRGRMSRAVPAPRRPHRHLPRPRPDGGGGRPSPDDVRDVLRSRWPSTFSRSATGPPPRCGPWATVVVEPRPSTSGQPACTPTWCSSNGHGCSHGGRGARRRRSTPGARPRHTTAPRRRRPAAPPTRRRGRWGGSTA